ncbi:hypothetical protein [Oryzicola mucosus]|uniref:Uncharacterized protein n=1 Tax=Oryzicola mucosus TaxID=2767425 RepID=A0A8J6TYJ2_9HYPH|nr:hypothetical protein [Oryzicola mucosus]MBD0414789.1 hypothetical protein [Oryzicola mucosus]
MIRFLASAALGYVGWRVVSRIVEEHSSPSERTGSDLGLAVSIAETTEAADATAEPLRVTETARNLKAAHLEATASESAIVAALKHTSATPTVD